MQPASSAFLPLSGPRSLDPAPIPQPLREAARTRAVPEGAAIVREGSPADWVAAVLDGALAVACTTPGGRRAVLDVLGPGEVFGALQEALPERSGARGGEPLMAVLGEPPPEIRALTAARVAIIPVGEVRAGFRREPDVVGPWVSAAAVKRWRASSRAVRRSLTLRVEERVLQQLLDLAERFGRPAPYGVRIGLPLSQELLASMVGATRESVNRALCSLSGKGSVHRSGRWYGLPRPPIQVAGGLS